LVPFFAIFFIFLLRSQIGFSIKVSTHPLLPPFVRSTQKVSGPFFEKNGRNYPIMFIRALTESLLRSWGQRTVHAPPTRYEIALIHALYFAPLLWLGWSIASRILFAAEKTSGHGIGDILTVTGGLAAGTVAFLLWGVFYRKAALEGWALSHLLWIVKAYTSLALWSAFGALAFAVLLLFAAIAQPLAALLIYGLPLIAIGIAGMFFLRLTTGYARFLKRQSVRGYEGKLAGVKK
jgi:hypothetical protein